jgi:microcystin-dependent protein
MADPFVAEVRIFPFNFAPKGWAWCDNQLLPISQNTALFSLLGTMYGGDGKSNFALPGFQGSAVVNAGQGQGLSQYFEGQVGGTETVTLLQSEMPMHPHQMMAAPTIVAADSNICTGNSMGKSSQGNAYIPFSAPNSVQLSPSALTPAGGNQPHNNLMPYLTLYFNIALQGVFPARP